MDRTRILRNALELKFKGKGSKTRSFSQILEGIKKRGKIWHDIKNKSYGKMEEFWRLLSIDPYKMETVLEEEGEEEEEVDIL
jgi:hypothetical protein